MTGALTTVAVSPLLPWPLVAALALLALAVVALGLARRARGIWWRALALAAALAALVNPALVEETRELLPDIAVLVIDESASQNVGERKSQAAAAHADLERSFEAFPGLDVRTVTVGGAQMDEGAAPASGTRLFGALRDTLGRAARSDLRLRGGYLRLASAQGEAKRSPKRRMNPSTVDGPTPCTGSSICRSATRSTSSSTRLGT